MSARKTFVSALAVSIVIIVSTSCAPHSARSHAPQLAPATVRVVNYNWQEKGRTTVGEGAKIGCNVNLIAPVTIGRNAAVAAGSTIGNAVPDDALAVERAHHRNVEGWAARRGVGGASRQAQSDEEEKI